MVKQTKPMKPSSKEGGKSRLGSEYRFFSSISPHCYLPASIKATTGPEPSTGVTGYVISGSLGEADRLIVADDNQWPEPPHIAFANLRADDPRAVETFIKRYGLLSDLTRHGKDPHHDEGFRTEFSFEGSHVLIMQEELRSAWQEYKGYTWKIEEIEQRVEHDFAVDVVLEKGLVELRPKDLWALICFLFLRDYMAGKLGICENPECPAPYFRKTRRTQKICERWSPCSAYAQRKYSLNWWNTKGKKKREERQRRQQNEKSTKRSKR